MTTTTATTDCLGVEVRIGDTVQITAWGAPVRLIDCGKRAVVLGFSRDGNLVLDASRYSEGIASGGRSIAGNFVSVMRRDGAIGFEGNA